MGSAAAYHCARRGLRVAAFDRWRPPHTLGSSHGGSRIIRRAYHEAPQYVPLVDRAFDLWADLESESGRSLYRETGCLTLGPAHGEIVAGARRSAEQYHIPHDALDQAGIQRRFPAFRVPDGSAGIFEPRAGVLDPEACVAAHLDSAARAGADLHFDEPVDKWRADGEGFQLHTPAGDYRATQLVMAGGAWMPRLLSHLPLPLRVTRQRVGWFDIDPAHQAHTDPARMPVFMWQRGAPDGVTYGFPDLGEGIKIGWHDPLEDADPDTVRRDVSPQEADAMTQGARRQFHGVAGLHRAQACLYTNTPDAHFLLDRHPKRPGIILVSPCSGHGFKFSPAIGEAIADLVTGRTPAVDLRLFRADRLVPPKPAASPEAGRSAAAPEEPSQPRAHGRVQ